MDPEVIFGIFAVLLSLTSIYHSYYKGPSIIFQLEYKPDTEKTKNDIHTITTTLTLFFSNIGNRTGVVRKIAYNFFPEEKFEDFLFYIPGEILETFTLKESEVKFEEKSLSFHLKHLNLDYKNVPDSLTASNLLELLHKVERYKERRLSDFIRLLNENENFGKLEISMESTKRSLSRFMGVGFSEASESVELKTEDFREIFDGVEIGETYKIDKVEAVKKVLKDIKKIKRHLESTYSYIEHGISKKDLSSINTQGFTNLFLNKHSFHNFFLLERLNEYRETILFEIRPIIEGVKRLEDEAMNTLDLPETMKKPKETEIMKTLEEVRKEVISAHSKVSEIEEKVSKELETAMRLKE